MDLQPFDGELDAPVTKVTNNNIKQFAGIGADGYPVDKVPHENLTEAQIHSEIQRLQGGVPHQDLQPFSGELDTKLEPFTGDLDGEDSKFKSGQEYKATRDLIPSMQDISDTWDTLKKQWANRHNTPMTQTDVSKMLKEEGSQRSAVYDTLGAIPAMVAGGVHGIYDAATNMDASKGLKTAGNTMSKLLPSSLIGSKEDQDSKAYKVAMAPFTGIMDTLNLAPELAGEGLNAAGMPNAAAQVSDAGKLAVMAGAGFLGAKGAIKGLTGKARIEPVAPVPTEPTISASSLPPLNMEGISPVLPEESPIGDRPLPTIQDPDAPARGFPELFKDEPVVPERTTGPIDYGVGLGGFENPPVNEHGMQIPDVPDRLSLLDKDQYTTIPNPETVTGDLNRQKWADQATQDTNLRYQEQNDFNNHPEDTATSMAMRKAQEEAAYTNLRNTHEASKSAEVDAAYNAKEEVKNVQSTAMEANRQLEIARQAGEIDYKHLEDSGDKSLMGLDDTHKLTDYLRAGDLTGALAHIADNHTNPMYRDLASWLGDRVGGIAVKLHDEAVLQHGDRNVTGYFDPTTNTLGLSGEGAASPHTLMHEVIHSLTSDFLNTKLNHPLTIGLKDTFQKVLNTKGSDKFPNVNNVKEFAAEAMSNPKYQSFLKGIVLDKRNMFSRFIDSVKSMLGMKVPELQTAFDHAIDLSKQVAELSNEPVRAEMVQRFKDAGVPSKLIDLMATERDKPTGDILKNQDVVTVLKSIPGISKIGDQFNFTLKAPVDIIKLAKDGTDIPASRLETIRANLDAGGLMASLRHNNNPVIKYTFAFVDAANKAYEKAIRDNITNKQNGLKTLMQNLSKDDFTSLHSQLMLDEGQLERTPQQLAALGWNEKMVNTAIRLRELDKQMLDRVNKVRAEMNPPMEPITPRVGHLAGRFLGDFSHMVFRDGVARDGSPTREVVMRVSGTTSWGAKKLADYISEKHPEWTVDKQEYNAIKKSRNSDRFQGFQEMMTYLGKHDEHIAKALDTLDQYNRSTATNYLNAKRHGLDKKAAAGGLKGSEGNKEWLDVQTNAEQGMKGHLAYLDTSYKWVEMQKAMKNISEVITNPDVIKKMPNAIKWSTAYTDHALHRNQGYLADFATELLNNIGSLGILPNLDKVKSVKNAFDSKVPFTNSVGHSNLQRAVNWTSSAEMRNWMGLGNIPFAIKHMLLPFQKMPAMMTYLKTIGDVDGSMIAAGARSLDSYAKYLVEGTRFDGKFGETSKFQKEAFQYAKDNNVFNVDFTDTSGKIQSGKVSRAFGKVADLDFSVPEHAIRGSSFFMYAHLLEKSGMDTPGALSAAEHLTKFLYTDYAAHEAPRAIAKGGWIGQLALQLTRYKTNEISQLGFFNRERLSITDANHTAAEKIMSQLPLATHMASLLAFTGATGMMAFKEADEMYSLWMKYIAGKPDNITAVMQRTNAPDMVKYGLFSKLGIDSKISEAQLLPSPFPTTQSEISQLGLGFNLARYHDMFHAKQLGMSMMPSTFRGLAENKLFTKAPETQGTHAGSSLYENPNTGEGRIYRDPKTQMIRNIGFHTTAETNELNDNYSKTRIMQDNKDLADHVMEKAKGLVASGVPVSEIGKQLAPEYAKHQQEGQPDFGPAIAAYITKQNLSQKEQQLLRAANSNKPNSMKIFAGK